MPFTFIFWYFFRTKHFLQIAVFAIFNHYVDIFLSFQQINEFDNVNVLTLFKYLKKIVRRMKTSISLMIYCFIYLSYCSMNFISICLMATCSFVWISFPINTLPTIYKLQSINIPYAPSPRQNLLLNEYLPT